MSFVSSVEEVAESVKRNDRENLGPMPDLFPMNVEVGRIGDTLASFGRFGRRASGVGPRFSSFPYPTQRPAELPER